MFINELNFVQFFFYMQNSWRRMDVMLIFLSTDTTPPVITCASNAVTSRFTPNTLHEDDVEHTASDASFPLSTSYFPLGGNLSEGGTLFPPGDTNVTLYLSDKYGNIASCNFTVTNQRKFHEDYAMTSFLYHCAPTEHVQNGVRRPIQLPTCTLSSLTCEWKSTPFLYMFAPFKHLSWKNAEFPKSETLFYRESLWRRDLFRERPAFLLFCGGARIKQKRPPNSAFFWPCRCTLLIT